MMTPLTLRWLILLLTIPVPVFAGEGMSWSPLASETQKSVLTHLISLSADDIGAQGDQETTRAIRVLLMSDPIMEENHITVAVSQGRVYFTGTVHSEVERSRAEEIARQVSNVAQVVNNLTVDAPKILRMDLTIRDAVESELARSLFVNEKRIHVQVDDGIVLLTGFVDTLQERQAASDYAYNGGARLVVNKLKIASLEATNAPEQ